MNYKLICIDMDGTLLDDKKQVSQKNIEAIKKAYEKGIHIAIATGRTFASARYYLEDVIGVEGTIISLNGAYIRKSNSKDVIYKIPLTFEEVEEIYKVAERNNIMTHFNTEDMSISTSDETEKNRENNFNKDVKKGTVFEVFRKNDLINRLRELQEDILKISVTENKDREKFNRVREQMDELNRFEVVNSDVNYIEVMKKGCSKGHGVKILAESLKIKREEIMCIGDNENDLSMITYAGFGVAMGNGCELLKKASKYITDDNLNSGVAKAIDKVLHRGDEDEQWSKMA